MVIKVFCGEDFSAHEHEWKQFKEVCGLINEHYANSNELIYILSDFLLSNAQIDVVILTHNGPAILELKSYKGEIFGSENGKWGVKTEDNKERLLNVNLFHQLKDQRFAFLEKLNSIRIGNFEHVDVEKLAHIQCWGYFEKGSNYDIEQVGRGVRIWFDVITANNLIEKMMRSINAGYLLRPEDMDAIVEGLKLKEYTRFNKLDENKQLENHKLGKISNIEQLIKKYIYNNDIVILDAIYQWATNPTSQSAINKGARVEHDYHIKRNLKIRYGEQENYEIIIERLKHDISEIGIDFNVGYLKVENEIIKIFDKEDILLNETVNRLKFASDLEKIIAWLYAKVNNLFPYNDKYSECNLTKMDKLNTLFVATSSLKPPDDIISVLIKLGIINVLDYTSSNLKNYDSVYKMPQYLNKLIQEINISLPVPEFRNYTDSLYLEPKYFDQLRLIDELSKKDKGIAKISELSGRIIPKKGIISTYSGYVAISLLISKELKTYLTESKNKCLSIHTDIEHAFDNISIKYPQEVGVSPQYFAGFDYEWEVICDESSGIGYGFGVILTPWMTVNEDQKSPTDLLELISEKIKYLVLIVTHQDIPNLTKLLGDNIKLNLTILRIDENKIFAKRMGNKNKLIDDFLDEFTKIDYEIHNIGEEKETENENELKQAKQIITEAKMNEEINSEVLSNNNHELNEHEKVMIKSPEKLEIETFGKNEVKVFLGISENKQDVFWHPGNQSNGHLIIIGGSGAGKTETIRVITSEINKCGYPVLLIDFHGDMGISNSNMKTYNIHEGSKYFFNPLELNPRFRKITPLKSSSDFVDSIFINFPTLGIQQRDRLKDIIKGVYSNKKITIYPDTWNEQVSFKEIQQIVEETDDNTVTTLRAYLRDIFDYELFSGTEKISVSDIFSGISHFNLKNLPESLRALYADLLLRKIYSNLVDIGEISRGVVSDKDKFRLFVIVDESKLLVSEQQGTKAVLNKYATELRKYGIGLILASQIIEHFNEEILSNVAFKFCMKAENKYQAMKNNKFFGVSSEDLMGLEPGEGILTSINRPFKVRIIPTWERDKGIITHKHSINFHNFTQNNTIEKPVQFHENGLASGEVNFLSVLPSDDKKLLDTHLPTDVDIITEGIKKSEIEIDGRQKTPDSIESTQIINDVRGVIPNLEGLTIPKVIKAKVFDPKYLNFSTRDMEYFIDKSVTNEYNNAQGREAKRRITERCKKEKYTLILLDRNNHEIIRDDSCYFGAEGRLRNIAKFNKDNNFKKGDYIKFDTRDLKDKRILYFSDV